MKQYFFTFLLFIFVSFSYAQLSAVDYSEKEFAQFKTSKTYVVKTGNQSFDEEVERAMNGTWKVTSFDFITQSEFEKKINDKTASFLLPVIIETAKVNQDYHYMALFNGGKKRINAYKYDDMLAYAPINFWVDEKKLTDCGFRVRNMIESMAAALSLVQKNNYKGSSKKIVDSLKDHYNSKSAGIKNRTLLFCEESLGKNIKKEDISSLYPHKHEICSKEKLAQVIKDKSTEYFYFQPGITLNKSMFVFDPSNGEVVYFDYEMMGLSTTKKNIQKLTLAVDGKKK